MSTLYYISLHDSNLDNINPNLCWHLCTVTHVSSVDTLPAAWSSVWRVRWPTLNIMYPPPCPHVSVMSPGVMVLPRPQGPAPGPRHRPLLPVHREPGPGGGPVCAGRQGHPPGADNIQVTTGGITLEYLNFLIHDLLLLFPLYQFTDSADCTPVLVLT